MFMFPEPPPLDYYLTDISPIFVADGIFYPGKAAACHKYVAKQLKPIKRTLRDPIAPPQELDSSTLNRILEREKGGYVYPCGKDDGIVYDTLGSMPKWKRDLRGGQQSFYSTFPRSKQYELSYIRERRLKGTRCKRPMKSTKKETEETVKTDKEPCHFLEPPIWWKGEIGKPSSLPVGNINDYAFDEGEVADQLDIKISERLHMDHPKKYIPGVIHRIKNPEDTSMKDVLERADTFKVVIAKVETLPEDGPPVDRRICSPRKSPSRTKLDQDLAKIHTAPCDNDRRWQSSYKSTDVVFNDVERQRKLRKLTRPFLHELHTWYSKNKPTILRVPIRHAGKRPIPERKFSHL